MCSICWNILRYIFQGSAFTRRFNHTLHDHSLPKVKLIATVVRFPWQFLSLSLSLFVWTVLLLSLLSAIESQFEVSPRPTLSLSIERIIKNKKRMFCFFPLSIVRKPRIVIRILFSSSLLLPVICFLSPVEFFFSCNILASGSISFGITMAGTAGVGNVCAWSGDLIKNDKSHFWGELYVEWEENDM